MAQLRVIQSLRRGIDLDVIMSLPVTRSNSEQAYLSRLFASLSSKSVELIFPVRQFLGNHRQEPGIDSRVRGVARLGLG